MKTCTPQRRTIGAALLALAAISANPGAARAGDSGKPATETVAIHGQSTVIDQGTLPFHAPYSGTNSLTPRIGRETFDATLYAGFRPWRGAEVWANGELDQGFGVDNTLGVAGFPSGEAYKVGKSTPYFRLPRLFLRQTIDLGGERQKVDADLNQLAGAQTANRVVVTLGKFGVTDVFDTNVYAHDPRGDFLNWALIDTATFDYAADAWGYTYGAAVEWCQGRWTLRAGAFDLSAIPNNSRLDSTFGQDQYIVEMEERHTIGGQDGRLMLTGYLTRGRMGAFADAIALAAATGQPPSTASVRRYQSRTGVGLDLEQSLRDDLGLFVRAGIADGRFEPYEFTDVDETFAVGLSLSGKRWGRKDDTLGVAGVINGISKIHQRYFADGGLGILVGDGKLPHPGPEEIIEAYYKIALTSHLALSLDGQLATNPGYNRDRGPAPLLAARLHAQF